MDSIPLFISYSRFCVHCSTPQWSLLKCLRYGVMRTLEITITWIDSVPTYLWIFHWNSCDCIHVVVHDLICPASPSCFIRRTSIRLSCGPGEKKTHAPVLSDEPREVSLKKNNDRNYYNWRLRKPVGRILKDSATFFPLILVSHRFALLQDSQIHGQKWRDGATIACGRCAWRDAKWIAFGGDSWKRNLDSTSKSSFMLSSEKKERNFWGSKCLLNASRSTKRALSWKKDRVPKSVKVSSDDLTNQNLVEAIRVPRRSSNESAGHRQNTEQDSIYDDSESTNGFEQEWEIEKIVDMREMKAGRCSALDEMGWPVGKWLRRTYMRMLHHKTDDDGLVIRHNVPLELCKVFRDKKFENPLEPVSYWPPSLSVRLDVDIIAVRNQIPTWARSKCLPKAW